MDESVIKNSTIEMTLDEFKKLPESIEYEKGFLYANSNLKMDSLSSPCGFCYYVRDIIDEPIPEVDIVMLKVVYKDEK